MTIGITGATGHLGRIAIAELKTRFPSAEVVALVRDTAKAADLGVEAREADYKKPETLSKAFKGIDTLVLISSSDFDDRPGQHKNVIDAAKTVGVSRLIYTSILKGLDSPMILAADHKETEKDIAASGIPATIMRNGWYTENATGSLEGALAAGAIIGSAGDGKFSWAARADYAEALAVVAATDGHEGKIYELAGDTGYTMTEFAAEVSKLVGKTVPYNSLPAETYVDILKSFGLPEGYAQALADSDLWAAKGALFDDSKTLGKLIGRPTTPIAETIAKALGK